MKYWREGKTENGYGDKGFLLKSDGEFDNIISITKTANGMILLLEECHGHFGIKLTQEQAIEAFQEAIDIIAS